MDNLYTDDEDMFGEYPSCNNCYAMDCTGKCLPNHLGFWTPKLMMFREYLRCRKRAIDENYEGYMLVGDFIPDNWDEDFKLVGDGPPLFHDKVIAKYFEKLVKLDKDKMLLGDCTYWDEFRYWGYNPLDKVVGTDFWLPMDLDCGSIIPSDDSSTIEEEPKMSENLITMELNEDKTINKEEINSHFSYFIDCPRIDFVIKPDEEVQIYIEPTTNENLITMELNEDEAINKEEINSHFSDFIDCPQIDFVIKPDEEIQIYIVEVESDGIDKSYYFENGKEDVWRSNEKWIKVKRRKMDRESKAFFRCP